MYNERVKRLEKLFLEEVPLLVKQFYKEFAETYPKRYEPLGKISNGSKSITIFQFVEEYINKNYNIPFEISKHFDFHSTSIFYASTDDFGFTINIKSISEIPPELLEKYTDSEPGYVYDFGIFGHTFLGIGGLSNIIKKKIKGDIELECELIKLRIRSNLKRFFIQGGVAWRWIVADQIYFYGVDKFTNCLDHEFKQLEYGIGFFEKYGHLGEWDEGEDDEGFSISTPAQEHKNYEIEKNFYDELKKKKSSDYTYIDVLREKLLIKTINPNLIINANCETLGEVPLLELRNKLDFIKQQSKYTETYFSYLKYRRSNSDSDVIPIEFPINFNLEITDVIKDDGLIHEYLETFNEPENEIRKIFGLPKIGEGWISETNLFYEIKSHYINEVVIHHGRPTWLGKQHLDIFIPKYNIAIEYQGDQHYYPIEFFGGEQSFVKNKERDEKKRELCLKNNCNLIYVNPGYKIENVLDQINNLIKKVD